MIIELFFWKLYGRFLLKIKVDYPKYDDEVEIVNRYAEDEKAPVLKSILKKILTLTPPAQRLSQQVRSTATCLA